MKKSRLNHLLALLFLAPAISFGQWLSNGPYGGRILAMTQANNKVFAGTEKNGVFVSSDEGASWNNANSGLERQRVQALVSKNGKLFAGTDHNGVYFSSDNGATWTNRSNGLDEVYIVSLFASAAGIYASTPNEVYFSNDEGLTWTLATDGIPFSYPVYSWAQVDDIIYAGTYASGLYAGIDGSGSWSKVPGYPSLTGFVYALESNGNHLWAGASGGILHSDDGGVTWSLSNTGMPSSEWAQTLEYKSGVLLAGTHNGGLFRSTDNGDTWTAVNTGIHHWPDNAPQVYSRFEDIEFVGSSTALAGNWEGMYRSTDNGVTWNYHSNGIRATDVTEVSAEGNVVYAGTSTSGMFVSEDNGENWERRNNGLANPEVLATASQDAWIFAALLNDGVYRSNDKGLTWSEANTGIMGRAISLESDGNQVIALTAGSRSGPGRLWQTSDYGVTWKEVNTAAIPPISAIEVRGQSMYVGSYDGNVNWTNDGGLSWSDITGYIPTAEVSAILSISDNEVYVGTRGKGVWKIINNGHHVMSASTGMTNIHVTDLEVQNNVLFAGTWGGGVFVSQDNAASWFAVNEGLNNRFVSSLAAADMKVYVGTGTGVYHSGDDMYDAITILAGISEHTGGTVRLMPNPSAGRITISGMQSKSAELKVYDLRGALMYEESTTGDSHSVDLGALEKGVYVVRCLGEQDNFTARIVLQ